MLSNGAAGVEHIRGGCLVADPVGVGPGGQRGDRLVVGGPDVVGLGAVVPGPQPDESGAAARGQQERLPLGELAEVLDGEDALAPYGEVLAVAALASDSRRAGVSTTMVS
ncbi:MAG: hypothetical protein LC750_09220 [Actinobacteria bacterium]|nr:hypothetical protein [Actinomycetota bacterium]